MNKKYFILIAVLLIIFGFSRMSDKKDTPLKSNNQKEKCLVKYNEDKDGYYESISFFDDNGDIIKTFDFKENNPFLNTYVKANYRDKENLYKPSKNIDYKKYFNKSSNDFDFISFSVNIVYNIPEETSIIPISYSATIWDKYDGGVDARSVLFFLNAKGEIISKKIFKGINADLFVSKYGEYMSYNNIGLSNNAENTVFEGTGYHIIDTNNFEEMIKKIFPEYVSEKLNIDFIGDFVGNSIVIDGYKKEKYFYSVFDLENKLRYIKWYSVGELGILIKENKFYLVDHLNNNKKILFTQQKYKF